MGRKTTVYIAIMTVAVSRAALLLSVSPRPNLGLKYQGRGTMLHSKLFETLGTFRKDLTKPKRKKVTICYKTSLDLKITRDIFTIKHSHGTPA